MVKWAHAALNCQDIRKTEDFYTRYLGFERARRLDLEEFGEILYLRNGDAFLELRQASQEPAVVHKNADGPHAPGAIRHLALSTDNVDDLLAKIGEDTQIRLGPCDCGDPGERFVWVQDPDGVVVEIHHGFIDHD